MDEREVLRRFGPFYCSNKLRYIAEQIVKDKSSVPIEYPGFGVSTTSLHSPTKYANCNGVILFAGEHALLSHFPDQHCDIIGKDTRDSEVPYISKLVAKMRQYPSWKGRMQAALVGGKRGHLEFNKRFLASQRIPIIGEFLEECNGDEKWINKDIFVSAERGEAIVHSDKTGYHLLAIRGPAF